MTGWILSIYYTQWKVGSPSLAQFAMYYLSRETLISMVAPSGCNGSILLKKSAMASEAEKNAPEIEIFTFGRG